MLKTQLEEEKEKTTTKMDVVQNEWQQGEFECMKDLPTCKIKKQYKFKLKKNIFCFVT